MKALAVDTTRLPNVKSIDDLAGLTVGVQQGNTRQPIAERLVAEGKAARVRVYDYGAICSALTDLTTGACDVFMKLAPVLTELVKPVAGVEVVQRGLSVEDIAVAVPLTDQGTPRRHNRGPGSVGKGRNVATDTAEMAGQPRRRPKFGGALNQPARGEYHTTRLAGADQGKKGRHK